MRQARTRPLVAFYGDDFTGSSENFAQFCRWGLRGRLFFETTDPALIEAATDLDVVGIAGTSRSLPPEGMAPVLDRAFAILDGLGARLIQYKVCSTFDSGRKVGNFAVAIERALERWPDALVPVLAATPEFGRYTAFSNHFSRHQGEILRLDRNPALVDHPATPMREADLRRHLLDLGCGAAAAIHWPQLGGDLVRLLLQRGANGTPVVIDAMSDADIARVGAALWEAGKGRPVFALAAQGLAYGLGQVIARERSIDAALPGPEALARVEPMLVLSGSCSQQTARQLDAVEAAGWTMIALPMESPGGVVADMQALAETVGGPMIAALQAGRSVAVYTARGRATVPADHARTRALGALMARLFRLAATDAGVRRIALAGGDTSSYAMTALGADALDIVSFDPGGCHVFRLHARDGLDGTEVLLKGGQVGADSFFLDALGRR